MFGERIVYNLPKVTKIRFLKTYLLYILSKFGILKNPFETTSSQMELSLRCKL